MALERVQQLGSTLSSKVGKASALYKVRGRTRTRSHAGADRGPRLTAV